MIFFITAGLLSVLLAFLSYYRNSRTFLYISLFIIFYIIAFQDAIGCDFPNYQDYFNAILVGDGEGVMFRTGENQGGLEIGWYLLNFFLGKWFHSFYSVTIVVALIYSFTLFQLLIRIPSQWHWVAIAYFYFQPMLFFMSGLRQGLAICFFVMAILQLNRKEYLKAILLLALGFTFHNSIMFGLLFIPLYYLFYSKWLAKHITIFTIIVSSVFAVGLFFANSIQTNISSYYVDVMDSFSDIYSTYIEEMSGTSYSLLNIISKLFVFAYTIIAFRNSNNKYLWILGMSIIAQIGVNLFGYIGTVGRVMLYVSIFTVPTYSLIPLFVKDKGAKYLFVAFVFFIAIRSFINSLTITQFEGYLHYHTIFNLF